MAICQKENLVTDLTRNRDRVCEGHQCDGGKEGKIQTHEGQGSNKVYGHSLDSEGKDEIEVVYVDR